MLRNIEIDWKIFLKNYFKYVEKYWNGLKNIYWSLTGMGELTNGSGSIMEETYFLLLLLWRNIYCTEKQRPFLHYMSINRTKNHQCHHLFCNHIVLPVRKKIMKTFNQQLLNPRIYTFIGCGTAEFGLKGLKRHKLKVLGLEFFLDLRIGLSLLDKRSWLAVS